MPQPFIHRLGKLKVGPPALEAQPELAKLMALVIVSWTALETSQAMMFCTLMDGEDDVSLDIYHAFIDPKLRQEVFLTVAKRHCSAAWIDGYNKFCSHLKPSSKARNKVAHSTWCYTDEHPDCLCVIEEKDISAGFVRTLQTALADYSSRVELDDTFIGKKLTRYNAKDFSDILQAMYKLGQVSLGLAVRMGIPDKQPSHERSPT